MNVENKRLRIRKYPNRRYYDSTRSRHMTLEEIYTAIREGCEIEVTDSKTGEDITARVLAQMIIELDAPKLSVFPVALLHRLLRANEQLLNDFTRKYFSQALGAFLDSQKKFEQSLRNAMGLKPGTPTVADWAGMMWGPFNPSNWNESAPSGVASTDINRAASESDSADANKLQQEVANTQKQVTQQKRRKAPRKGKSSKR